MVCASATFIELISTISLFGGSADVDVFSFSLAFSMSLSFACELMQPEKEVENISVVNAAATE